MAAISPPLRPFWQRFGVRLRRLLSRPSHCLQLCNRSMAAWTFELAAGAGFHCEGGSLAFYLVDPATGGRRFSAWLGVAGDGVLLRAGATYQVEVFSEGGAFARCFQLVDARGSANGARFFMDADGGKGAMVVRVFDGGSVWNPAHRPLQHTTPGILEISRNGWQDRGLDKP